MKENTWFGIDPDDIDGYLIDYLYSWMRDHDINSLDDFDDLFQTDDFVDDVAEAMEQVVSALLEKRSSS